MCLNLCDACMNLCARGCMYSYINPRQIKALVCCVGVCVERVLGKVSEVGGGAVMQECVFDGLQTL